MAFRTELVFHFIDLKTYSADFGPFLCHCFSIRRPEDIITKPFNDPLYPRLPALTHKKKEARPKTGFILYDFANVIPKMTPASVVIVASYELTKALSNENI